MQKNGNKPSGGRLSPEPDPSRTAPMKGVLSHSMTQ